MNLLFLVAIKSIKNLYSTSKCLENGNEINCTERICKIQLCLNEFDNFNDLICGTDQ